MAEPRRPATRHRRARPMRRRNRPVSHRPFTDSPRRGGIDVDRILDLIDSGDLCGTAFLILLLAGVGSKMVEGHDGARRAGLRLSAAAFIAYVLFAVLQFDPSD